VTPLQPVAGGRSLLGRAVMSTRPAFLFACMGSRREPVKHFTAARLCACQFRYSQSKSARPLWLSYNRPLFPQSNSYARPTKWEELKQRGETSMSALPFLVMLAALFVICLIFRQCWRSPAWRLLTSHPRIRLQSDRAGQIQTVVVRKRGPARYY